MIEVNNCRTTTLFDVEHQNRDRLVLHERTTDGSVKVSTRSKTRAVGELTATVNEEKVRYKKRV